MEREREREAETQAKGEAGSMQEPDMRLDPGTPGLRPGPKAGAKPLSHRGIPSDFFFFNPPLLSQLSASHSIYMCPRCIVFLAVSHLCAFAWIYPLLFLLASLLDEACMFISSLVRLC